MEKLEQEMNAPEKMAETPSPKKTAGKKKKFRKNQVIITALADFWNQAIEQSPALQENKELMKDMFDADKINSLSAIDITMQMLSSDVFFGSILAIPTGLMVMKKAKPGNNEPS